MSSVPSSRPIIGFRWKEGRLIVEGRVGTRLPYQMTLAGMVYLACTAFVLVATINSGTNLLYFVFGLMVGGIVVSLLFPAIALRKVRIVRYVGEHAIAGEPVDVEYEIINGKRRWACIGLKFEELQEDLEEAPQGYVQYVPPRGSVRLAARMVPRRRGRILLSTVRLSCAFPFGFLARVVQREFPQEMIVYPRIGVLNRQLAMQYRETIESGTMTSNIRGGADEFYGLREYRPGDNIRAIHWRSTARTQQLMIREMAANAPPQMIVLLNLRSAGRSGEKKNQPMTAEERNGVERAIELAAALVCYGFYENFAVALAIAGVEDQSPPSPQMGRDARALMLRRLATLEPSDVDPGKTVVAPNRLAGRAELLLVTLHSRDEYQDLVHVMTTTAGGLTRGGSTQHTVLSLDSPEAGSWMHFLKGEDTLRLLREREAQ